MQRQGRDRVHRDHVDVGILSAEQRGQFPSVLRCVILSGQQDVLIRHTSPGPLEVFLCGLQDSVDPDRLVHRHNLGAQVVVGRVQRHGQVVRRPLSGEFTHPLRQSHGRHGDPSRTKSHAPANAVSS